MSSATKKRICTIVVLLICAVAIAPAQPRAGESRLFNRFQFVWVPAGEFLMGSTSSVADDNESPVTRVRISQGFWLGKFEVTQHQWQAVMGRNPSEFDECGLDCPVENVTWNKVQHFIRILNARAGGNWYRLPTEAEWEYAARARTTGDTYSGNLIAPYGKDPLLDAIAWYGKNITRRGTHPVGGKAANLWGLHDMLGNVWELVEDRYGEYPGGTVMDPRGPLSGRFRVARGCGWPSYAGRCRAAVRVPVEPDIPLLFVLGFRLLRTE